MSTHNICFCRYTVQPVPSKQMTNETTDINIADIKRVCEEIMPGKIERKHLTFGLNIFYYIIQQSNKFDIQTI